MILARHLAFGLASVLTLVQPAGSGMVPSEGQSDPELSEARRTGWQLAALIVKPLEAGDQARFPGIRAWLKDYRKVADGIQLETPPDRWPPFDVEALVARNPEFWRMASEIAPGDPGLTMLHGGLLLAGGEAVRATHVVAVGAQRPGVPKDVRTGFEILLAQSQRAGTRANAVVKEGIELHDAGDHAGAVAKYRAALALWPQNGFAHYELGFSLREMARRAAGLPIEEVGKLDLPEVDAAFARARRHDPFQIIAYQGRDPAVIRGFQALGKSALPAWKEVSKDWNRPVEDDVLRRLADGCQEARYHELALVTCRVLVARRGSYRPEDHPFLSTSLRALAPGEPTEATLRRLAGPRLELRQLVKPEPDEGRL